MNYSLELLAEELIVVRQGQLPIQVGGCPRPGTASQAAEDLADTAELVLVVIEAEGHVITQLGQKAVQQPRGAIEGAWI